MLVEIFEMENLCWYKMPMLQLWGYSGAGQLVEMPDAFLGS